MQLWSRRICHILKLFLHLWAAPMDARTLEMDFMNSSIKEAENHSHLVTPQRRFLHLPFGELSLQSNRLRVLFQRSLLLLLAAPLGLLAPAFFWRKDRSFSRCLSRCCFSVLLVSAWNICCRQSDSGLSTPSSWRYCWSSNRYLHHHSCLLSILFIPTK